MRTKYTGFFAKTPIIAAILINFILYPWYGIPKPFDAFMNMLVIYVLCRWIVVPLFANVSYINQCKKCGKTFLKKLEINQCDDCFQQELTDLMTKKVHDEMRKIEKEKLACEGIVYQIMYERLVIEKTSLREEDVDKIKSNVIDLYNQLMESSISTREYVLTNVFKMEIGEFNPKNFIDLISSAILFKLTNEGELSNQ